MSVFAGSILMVIGGIAAVSSLVQLTLADWVDDDPDAEKKIKVSWVLTILGLIIVIGTAIFASAYSGAQTVKKVGSGATQFVKNNPELVQGAAEAALL